MIIYESIKLSNNIWYHMVPKGTDISNGICSLQYMYDNGMYGYLIDGVDKYRYRLVHTWKYYPNIDPEDLSINQIFDGLNRFRGKYGTKCIYLFRYPPFPELGSNMSKVLSKKDVYEVDLSKVNDIVHVDYNVNDGPGINYYKSIDIKNYFSGYDDDAEKHGKLLFAGIPHISIATSSGRIPISALRKLKSNDFSKYRKEFYYG